MWTKKSLKGASGRSSHTLTSVGGKVYIVGGEDGPRTLVPREQSVVQISLQDSSFSAVEGAAVTVLGHCAANLGDQLHVFGGRQGGALGQGKESNSVWRMQLGHFQQVTIKGKDQPRARSYHAASSFGHFLFVYGGVCGPDRVDDLWRYDAIDESWLQLHAGGSGSPGVRGGAVLFAAAEDLVYVFFGFNGGELRTGFRFKDGAWSPLSCDMPPARSVVPSCRVGDKLVLFGGEKTPAMDGHAGAGTFHPDVWYFEATDERWTQVDAKGDIPQPCGWTEMAELSNTSAMLFGGLNSENQRLASCYILNLAGL